MGIGECVVMTRIIMNFKKVREGLVVSNGCTLSHLAVLESGATPTRRKGRVGRVCVRCCSNYFTLRGCGTVRLIGRVWCMVLGEWASPIVFLVIQPSQPGYCIGRCAVCCTKGTRCRRRLHLCHSNCV